MGDPQEHRISQEGFLLIVKWKRGQALLLSEWVDEPLAEMPLPKSFFVEYPQCSGAVQTFLPEAWKQASYPLGVLVSLAAFPPFLGPSVWLFPLDGKW